MNVGTLERVVHLFQEGPLAAIAGAMLLAIATLFVLLQHSQNERLKESRLYASGLTKMEDLHERTVGALEENNALLRAKERRRVLRSPTTAKEPTG